MTVANPTLAKFGVWLQNEYNFYLFFILGFGIPIWLITIWLTCDWDVAGALWSIYLAGVSLGASLSWAIGMRRFCSWYFPSLRNGGPDN